ncbi:unnamed protein product [Aureobasidium uvarum]|uniref:Uncharacterized protein n=1 Tax=Aureobasidium uvarum TaxID=2773716 RepID=A0A9N8PTW3_9PEZI|nr:unnamed protein product [Aureobasidium uvarum]
MANLTTILGTDGFPPICDALTAHLPIKDIIALTHTCRALEPLYQKLVSNGAWDINKRLEKFVKDPRGFRKRLAELDGIISGGFALQFMDRVEWNGSDLDVCVQVGENADAFCRYMEEVEGYDLASRKVGKYAWTHVDMYDKVVDGEFVRLEIILTHKHPIHSTLSTYTTALVNAITGNHAYCVFPNATFIKRQTYPTRIPDYFNGVILTQKYKDRGWEFIQRIPKKKRVTEELDLGYRRIGDKHTWKIALSPISDEAADNAEGAVEGLEFEMEKCQDSYDGVELKWLGVAAKQQVD